MASTASSVQTRVHSAQLMDHRNPRAAHLESIEPAWGDERAARGNLYILIELIGSSPVGIHAVREMQATVELTYYSAGGPVSQVLRQAIGDAHEILRNMNRHNPDIDLQAGITCAAVVQGHLVIASAGPTVAFISTSQRLDQFPLDEERYSGTIGGETEPNVHTYRHVLDSGDALFLGESEWTLQSDVRTIGGAVVSTTVGNLQEMVTHLRQQGDNVPLLGLLLVCVEEEDGGEEEAVSPLPTAVGATPPVHNVPGGEGSRGAVPLRDRMSGFYAGLAQCRNNATPADRPCTSACQRARQVAKTSRSPVGRTVQVVLQSVTRTLA